MLQVGSSRVRVLMRCIFSIVLNPSSRTMALGSTQPPTEMSTRNLPGGKGRPARKAENLTTICEPIGQKVRELRRFTILWASTACYRIALPFYTSTFLFINVIKF
jgi:hypothetical protein